MLYLILKPKSNTHLQHCHLDKTQPISKHRNPNKQTNRIKPINIIPYNYYGIIWSQ